MSLVLTIVSVIAIAASIVLGLALKKYQKLSFEKQVENRKLSDEFTQKIKDKEETISQHENQLTDLEKKIQSFDSERNEIYEQALKEYNKQNDNSNNSYKDKIVNLEQQIIELNNKNEELSTQSGNKTNSVAKKFKKEINSFQDENFKILDSKLNLESLQIKNQDNKDDNKISLLQLINSSNLEQNKEYIATEKQTENEQNILSYVIIFSGNARAFIIDGELSEFLIKNYELIKNNADSIKEDLENTLKQRIDFLNNETFKSELIETINELDGIAKIDKIYPCIYLPSENITSLLSEINPDIFSYANNNNIYHYTPAGIVNLILHAKSTLFAEQNIIRFQILSDIIEEDEFTIASDDIREDTKSENIAEEETEIKHDENELEDFSSYTITDEITDLENKNNAPIPGNTEVEEMNLDIDGIDNTEEPNNTETLPTDDTDNIEPQKTEDTKDLGVEPEHKKVDIDKFNIGTFLDGGDLELGSIEPQQASPNTTAEDDISHIADDIAKENPIDDTLKPVIEKEMMEDEEDQSETKSVIQDFSESADKIAAESEKIGELSTDINEPDFKLPTEGQKETEITTEDPFLNIEEEIDIKPQPPENKTNVNQKEIENTKTSTSEDKKDNEEASDDASGDQGDSSDNKNPDSKTSTSKESEQKGNNPFKNIDPNDFDIEAFLNE